MDDSYIFSNDENEQYKDSDSTPYKRKRERRRRDDSKKPSRKNVNFPASLPYIRIVDGEERLCFKYNTKISENALSQMPRTELDDNEFCVRFDLDSVDVTKLNDKFKNDNCVYPRANCDYDEYKGNRWDYETECNRLAWQFVSLNPVLLYGKKGLIQRAVDSYRNIYKDNKRKYKQDRIVNGVLQRRYSELTPTTANIYWTVKGNVRKCRVRVDIDIVNYDKIDAEFKTKYSVFPDEFDDRCFGLENWESNNPDNELAVKIAYVNVENTAFWNAVKANDRILLLRKAVEAYKALDDYESESEKNEFGDIVSSTMERAFSDDDDFLFLEMKNEE